MTPTFVPRCIVSISRTAIFRAAIFTLLLGLVSLDSPANAQLAPPAQEATQAELLQQQLSELQRQLQTMQASSADTAGRRVKSVGLQRPKKIVEPVVDDSIQIRLYDLSDIFAVSPHYRARHPHEIGRNGSAFDPVNAQHSSGGGGFGGGGGGGVFNIGSGSIDRTAAWQEADTMNLSQAQISMTKLVDAIKVTVSPDQWGKGSDDAKIQMLGNTMLISATDGMHQQINSLLNLFRQHWGKLRTVSVEAWWVRATPDQTAAILSAEHQQQVGVGVVTPDKWAEYLKSAQSEKRLAYSTTLSGHNNQTLSGMSGRQRRLIVDATPLKARTKTMDVSDDDELKETSVAIVGMRPEMATLHCGAVIQATPLATRGGNYVVLDLHAKVNELLDDEQQRGEPNKESDLEALAAQDTPAPPTPRPSVVAHTPDGTKIEMVLDATDYVSHQLNTTLRCPKAAVVLAGGMTMGKNTGSDATNLYLFVRTLVHTIDEDQSDWDQK